MFAFGHGVNFIYLVNTSKAKYILSLTGEAKYILIMP